MLAGAGARSAVAQPQLTHDHGIELRIEIRLAAEDFCGDLVFLERRARMFQGVVGQVAKELAERFGSMQRLTVNKSINFRQDLGPQTASIPTPVTAM